MVILGLGSNLGNRAEHLSQAVKILGETALAYMQLSPVYETPALLMPHAPADWNKPFLNMAVMGETHMTPIALLGHIKMLEKKLGRNNGSTAWAPREIDIDILAFDSQVVDVPNLMVPHAELCNRAFAIVPLADLAPNWRYPGSGAYNGKTAYELAKQFTSACVQKTEIDLGQRLVA